MCHRDEAIDEASDTHSHIQAVLHRDKARNGTEKGWTTMLHRNEAIAEAIELGGTSGLHKDEAINEQTDNQTRPA